MDNLILKRCKYCDKTYEGTSEICCCSEPCNIKYQKYMKQREKTETPVKIFSIILLLIFFINIMNASSRLFNIFIWNKRLGEW